MSTPVTGRTDTQVLVGLRIALVAIIALSIGSMAVNAVNFGRYGGFVTIQLLLRGIFGLLPVAAVLVAVSIRTPPAGVALDAAAGYGIASLLTRFVVVAASGIVLRGFEQPLSSLTVMLLWMVAFSVLDMAVAALAIYLRGRVGRVGAMGLIVATVAFLLWNGLVHAAMQFLFALVY